MNAFFAITRRSTLAGIKGSGIYARWTARGMPMRGAIPLPSYLMKLSDFRRDSEMSMDDKLRDLMPSAHGGPFTGRTRDVLRRQYGF